MVYIVHPTVFSLTYGLESPTGRRSANLLQLLTKYFVMTSFLLNVIAIIERGKTVTVVRGNQKSYTSVVTCNITYIRIVYLVGVTFYGYVQKELVTLVNDFSCSKGIYRFVKILFHTFNVIVALDTPGKRTNRKLIAVKGIIPVP